jgi:MYXO-CTERM domain-containing protein
MTRRSLACVLLAALIGVPLLAHAYVRSTTSTGTALDWRKRCTELILDDRANPAFSHERLRRVLQRSMAAWNEPIGACTEFALSVSDRTVSNADVDYDETNTVLWRLPGFCDEPDNALEDVCLAPNAVAITTVFYFDKPGDSRDGELVEADIVINADGFAFADNGSAHAIDLESVMTHELGHVMGLDHPCATTSGAVAPVDHEGKEVPSCFPIVALADDVTAATMFNFLSPGETQKQTPLDDEWRGVCAIYAEHTGDCAPAGGCGCRTSGPIDSGWLLFVGVALALLCRRQRP